MKYLFRENNNEVKVNKILDLYRKLLNETTLRVFSCDESSSNRTALESFVIYAFQSKFILPISNIANA